jgi:hypothetical protein
MAKSMGFAQITNGDLYEVFDDGTTKLVEGGYEARVIKEAKAANEKLYGTGANITPTQVAATPPSVTATTTVSSSIFSPVKTATKDIILFNDEAVPIALMTDLIFEDIGGQELLSIARRDTVNGQKIIYQPIKNLTSIEQQYNPNNIIGLQATSDKYFANFPIKIDLKVPEEGSGPNGEYLYISRSTGDLVIDVVNLELGEQLEIQIAAGGTIYEAEI